VPGFDQYQAAFPAERLVLTQVRASQPTARGVVAMFIGKHPFNDKNLFAAMVPVRTEIGAGSKGAPRLEWFMGRGL